MNNINKLSIGLGVFVFLVFTACSNKSGDTSKKRDNYTGTWELDSTSCDGEDVSNSGLSESFELDVKNERGKNEVTGSSCIARTKFKIKKAGNILTFENDSYSCSPQGCSISYFVTFDGKKTSYKHKCPGDFPSNARIKARLSVSGNHFTTELTSTDGMSCINTYRKRN